ncbi:trypsin-like peptidase domain-containing protein [Streptomyces sp. BK79]|uniref:trypsin-like peptidase domain-containing protein n=1 Tax=Streptomyces sp. BK79 TaxID=3350097 RepID=UPI00376FB414
MTEGKPTKAKWWSRPRSSGDATDGDFELERPRTAPATGTDGGDYELERPAAPHATDEGDYELDRPAAGPDGRGDATPRPRTAPDPRDPAAGHPPAVPRPTPPSDAAPHPGAGPRTAGADEGADLRTGGGPGGGPPTSTPTGAPADPTPGGTEAADAGPPVSAGADAPPHAGTGPRAAEGGDAGAAVPVAERPKPLHEPDPYSTPPYGEPGPWAPAPPVQHPAATPAHGTATATAGTGPLPAPAAPVAPSAPPAGAMPDPAFADAPPPVPGAQEPPPAHPGPAAAAADGDGRGADPWRRYDPWAVPAAGTVPAAREPRRRARKLIVVGALVVALVSGGIGGAVGVYLERNGGVGTVELPQAGQEAVERAPDSVAGIAARALPSVVTLHASGGDAAGTGTGFVLDDRGHILTNNHVVQPAGSGGEITVTFHSGDTAEATVVGRDSGYDLAVVKVKGVGGLTPMPLGNSDNVRVGDPVVAIGAPFDLAGTVTSGIISAKERPITAGGEEGDGSDISYVDALQTDAPINPGNSGGPLLDSRGRAIGINSAIRSADSGGTESDGGQAGSIGLGFAIPVNQGKRVAEELINTGRATHPVIGITLDMNYTGDGARVGAKGSDGGPAVTTGGPGAEAGIRPGDVITAVDGKRVHSGEELIVRTRAHRPGDRLELTLERDGEETKVSLVLGSSDGG